MQYTYNDTLHACYLGYISQAIVNNLTPLLFIVFQSKFGISYEMIGRLIFMNFGLQIVIDFFAARYVDRIGYRKSAVFAHVFCASGLICLGTMWRIIPSPYMGLSISVAIYAVGGGLIEVLISPIVESLPGDEKTSAMSLLHSFYCWGQMGVVLITTVLIKLLGAEKWNILPILWSLIPLYNLLKFTKVPLMPTVLKEEKIPAVQMLSSDRFIISLILMLCAGASELTMSQWSSLFAEKGLKVTKIVGDLLGPCMFAFFMGIGRTIYGTMGYRINLRKALMASGALCITCYAVTVFVKFPVVSLIGCAVCGFSVSLMWPGTLSLTAAAFPNGGTVMFGMLAMFGDIGGAIGPWLAGFVSDMAQKSNVLVAIGSAGGLNPEQLGLKSGLLAGMIFPLALFICIVLLKKKNYRIQ